MRRQTLEAMMRYWAGDYDWRKVEARLNSLPMFITETLYTVTGGRDGAARSSDGRLDVKLSTPGGPGQGTNPEQLFAAGWSACFQGAMAIAAKAKGITLPSELAIDAEVELRQGDDGYVLAARLNVRVPGIDPDVARQIIEAAHRTCPYSKAIKGNIEAVVALV